MPASEAQVLVEVIGWGASGELNEAFACGTAAIVAGVGRNKWSSINLVVGDGGEGAVTRGLRAELAGIRRGLVPDTFGWTEAVEPA